MFDTAADAAKTVANSLVVPFQRRTYRAIGYLLLTLPLGLGYFAFIVLGFLLGFGLITKYTLNGSPAARARGDQLRERLVPYQATFGLISIACGALYIVWVLMH